MSNSVIFALVVPALCLVVALTARYRDGQVNLVVLALIALFGSLAVVATLNAGVRLVVPVGIEVVSVGAYLLYSFAKEQSAGHAPKRPMWLLGGLLLAASVVSVVGSLTRPKGSGAESALAATAQGRFVPSDRPIFNCPHSSDCPGPGYAVFNSYVNTPTYGDERSFFDARLATDEPYAPGQWHWSDALRVEPGNRVIMRIYYDNDGDARAEARKGESTARGVRVAVLLARNRDNRVTAAASISGSNAHPERVGDAVVLSSQRPINILLVPGTARIFNQAHPNGLPLDNGLFSGDGALIGYKKMDGVIRGCFCESAFITFQARVL